MTAAGDLKPALSRAINQILMPVRKHFEQDEKAKALLKKVKVGQAVFCTGACCVLFHVSLIKCCLPPLQSFKVTK